MPSPSYGKSDNMSVASSASTIISKFKIPDAWRLSIMECINKTNIRRMKAIPGEKHLLSNSLSPCGS